MELNTTNPHYFTYKTEELLIELLGGIKIDTLDRMRVTIKVTVINRKHKEYLSNPELAGLSVRHNLDLYNNTQVEKFVRRVAEKMETGSIAVTKAIADITSQLEEYRLKQLDKQEARKEKALTKEEREEAVQYLEQKDTPIDVPASRQAGSLKTCKPVPATRYVGITHNVGPFWKRHTRLPAGRLLSVRVNNGGNGQHGIGFWRTKKQKRVCRK